VKLNAQTVAFSWYSVATACVLLIVYRVEALGHDMQGAEKKSADHVSSNVDIVEGAELIETFVKDNGVVYTFALILLKLIALDGQTKNGPYSGEVNAKS
jgi:hypothetical protein